MNMERCSKLEKDVRGKLLSACHLPPQQPTASGRAPTVSQGRREEECENYEVIEAFAFIRIHTNATGTKFTLASLLRG